MENTRDLGKFGGLSAHMPVYAFFLTFCSLASLGLPGLSGFVSEFLSLVGAYPVFPWLTGISVLGLIITAGFFLWMIQRVLLGPVNTALMKFQDMNREEIFALVPLTVIMAVIGFCPSIVLRLQETAVNTLIS